MNDYRQVDVSTLTLEDALSDREWGRRPCDYFSFLALDAGVLEGFTDFTGAELAETMRAVAAYCVTGEVPDYSSMGTTAVKLAVRTIIRNHDARINAEFLKHYKQFVTATKKKQEQAAGSDLNPT